MALSIMVLSIILGLMLTSAFICHYVAKHRQSNPVFWGAMGFTFGPLAIPFVFLSKPTSRKPTPAN